MAYLIVVLLLCITLEYSVDLPVTDGVVVKESRTNVVVRAARFCHGTDDSFLGYSGNWSHGGGGIVDSNLLGKEVGLH